jgi:hypothetical protein
MINSPGKNFAYSNCRGKFVNDFNHTRWVAPPDVAPKRVDSSSVSRKSCLWLVSEGWRCGKAEEASGKKDLAKIRRFAEYNQRNAEFVKGVAKKILALEKIEPWEATEIVSGRIYFREYESGTGTSFRKAGRFAASAREQETLPKASLSLRTRL